MYNYEMDPTRTVGTTERTRNAEWTDLRTDRRMDRRTDGRGETNNNSNIRMDKISLMFWDTLQLYFKTFFNNIFHDAMATCVIRDLFY